MMVTAHRTTGMPTPLFFPNPGQYPAGRRRAVCCPGQMHHQCLRCSGPAGCSRRSLLHLKRRCVGDESSTAPPGSLGGSAPSQQPQRFGGGEKGGERQSAGTAMGTWGTHADAEPAAQAGQLMHRAGRRCGSSVLLLPVGVRRALSTCRAGTRGHSHLPVQPSRAGAACHSSHGQHLALSLPEPHLEGDTGLLQQVGLDGGPHHTGMAEANLNVLPEAAAVVVPGSLGVPKGLAKGRFCISRCSRGGQPPSPIHFVMG